MKQIEFSNERAKNLMILAKELRRKTEIPDQPLAFEIASWPSKPVKSVELLGNLTDLQDISPQRPEELEGIREKLTDFLGIEISWDASLPQLNLTRTTGQERKALTIDCQAGTYFTEGPINPSDSVRTPGCFHPSLCQLMGSLMAVDDHAYGVVKENGILICSRQLAEPSLALEAALLPGKFWQVRATIEKPVEALKLKGQNFYPLDGFGVIKLNRSLKENTAFVSGTECPLVVIVQASVLGEG